jgi:hypothetical protein
VLTAMTERIQGEHQHRGPPYPHQQIGDTNTFHVLATGVPGLITVDVNTDVMIGTELLSHPDVIRMRMGEHNGLNVIGSGSDPIQRLDNESKVSRPPCIHQRHRISHAHETPIRVRTDDQEHARRCFGYLNRHLMPFPNLRFTIRSEGTAVHRQPRPHAHIPADTGGNDGPPRSLTLPVLDGLMGWDLLPCVLDRSSVKLSTENASRYKL